MAGKKYWKILRVVMVIMSENIGFITRFQEDLATLYKYVGNGNGYLRNFLQLCLGIYSIIVLY